MKLDLESDHIQICILYVYSSEQKVLDMLKRVHFAILNFNSEIVFHSKGQKRHDFCG